MSESNKYFFPFYFADTSQELLSFCIHSNLSVPTCNLSKANQAPRPSFFLAEGFMVVEYTVPLVAPSIAPKTVALSDLKRG